MDRLENPGRCSLPAVNVVTPRGIEATPPRRGSDSRGVNPRLPGSLRHTFLVRYRTTEDGIAFFVPSLPGVRGRTTGRKGLAAAARNRIALELDLPDTAFDVELQLVPK